MCSTSLDNWQCHTARLAIAGQVRPQGRIEATLRDARSHADAGQGLWIGLYRAGEGVVVEVWDRTREPSRLVAPDRESIRGRGLLVVAGLAEGWGYRWPKTGGKIVWALLKGTI
jgi:hypothetical protein